MLNFSRSCDWYYVHFSIAMSFYKKVAFFYKIISVKTTINIKLSTQNLQKKMEIQKLKYSFKKKDRINKFIVFLMRYFIGDFLWAPKHDFSLIKWDRAILHWFNVTFIRFSPGKTSVISGEDNCVFQTKFQTKFKPN